MKLLYFRNPLALSPQQGLKGCLLDLWFGPVSFLWGFTYFPSSGIVFFSVLWSLAEGHLGDQQQLQQVTTRCSNRNPKSSFPFFSELQVKAKFPPPCCRGKWCECVQECVCMCKSVYNSVCVRARMCVCCFWGRVLTIWLDWPLSPPASASQGLCHRYVPSHQAGLAYFKEKKDDSNSICILKVWENTLHCFTIQQNSLFFRDFFSARSLQALCYLLTPHILECDNYGTGGSLLDR